MSANILNKKHFDALCKFAKQYDMVFSFEGKTLRSRDHIDEIGQILVNENYRSVNYRYNENEQPEQYQYCGYLKTTLSPVQIIKACAGYVYQACETPDYEATLAMQIIKKIDSLAYFVGGYIEKGVKKENVNTLPEYGAARCEITQ